MKTPVKGMERAIGVARQIAAKVDPAVAKVPMPKMGRPVPLLHYPIPGFANGGKTIRAALRTAKADGGSMIGDNGGPPMDDDIVQNPNRKLNPMGLYSAAAENARSLKQGKMPVAQMVKAMQGRSKNLNDELKWSGAQSKFDPNKSVTKEDFADALEEGMPQLEKKTRHQFDWSHPDYPSFKNQTDWQNAEQALTNELGNYNFGSDERNAIHGKLGKLDTAYRQKRQEFRDKERNNEVVKFHSYMMPSNHYREDTIRWAGRPEGSVDYNDFMQKAHEIAKSTGDYTPDSTDIMYNGHRAFSNSTINKTLKHFGINRHAGNFYPLRTNDPETFKEIFKFPVTQKYTASHWPEDDVVAHTLTHVRTADEHPSNLRPGQTALHLDEIQSDYGQAARNVGLANQDDLLKAQEHLEEIKRKIEKEARQPVLNDRKKRYGYTDEQANKEYDDDIRTGNFDHWRHSHTFDESNSFNTNLNREYSQAMDAVDRQQNKMSDAPYIGKTENWVDLGLKDALTRAAREGHSALWTSPGAVPNARYLKSKPFDYLNVRQLGGGDDDIEVRHYQNGRHTHTAYHEPDELKGVYGEHIANQINESINSSENFMPHERRDIHASGEVGGHAFRAFYDKMVPDRLRALARMHDPDAQVNLHAVHMGHTPVDNRQHASANVALHELKITPKMRRSILRNGFPHMKRGGFVHEPSVSHALKVARHAKI